MRTSYYLVKWGLAQRSVGPCRDGKAACYLAFGIVTEEMQFKRLPRNPKAMSDVSRQRAAEEKEGWEKPKILYQAKMVNRIVKHKEDIE